MREIRLYPILRGVAGDSTDWLARAQERALEIAAEYNLPAHRLAGAFGALADALGTAWLNGLPAERIRGAPLDFYAHELGRLLGMGGVPDLMELLELGLYLRTLAVTPGFDAACDVLRNDYEHGMTQLAWAYRFQRIGANDLRLEPPAEGGRKGDLAFELGGRRFLVECYCPRWPRDEVDLSVKRLLGEGVRDALRENPANLGVAIGDPRGKRFARFVEREVVRAIAGTAESQLVEFDHDGHLTVRAKPFSSPSDPSPADAPEMTSRFGEARLEGALSWIRRSDAQHLWRRRTPTPVTARLAIWLPGRSPRLEADDWWTSLTEKIAPKLPQTRSEDGALRGLVVCLRDRSDWRDPVGRLLETVHRRLFSGRETLAFVVIVYRDWTTRNRHRFAGVRLFGDASDALSVVKQGALEAIERTDLLSYL